MTGTPALELANISKSFGNGAVHAVRDLSFTVQPGEIVSILGPSGCGKTTTMRMIAGLEAPTRGDILVAGRSIVDMPTHKRGIGLVFQSLAIFPHMNVEQNVAFGLRMKGLAKAEIRRKVAGALDLVHLPAGSFATGCRGR